MHYEPNNIQQDYWKANIEQMHSTSKIRRGNISHFVSMSNIGKKNNT